VPRVAGAVAPTALPMPSNADAHDADSKATQLPTAMTAPRFTPA
jgi:hypothetical protein